MIKYLTDDSESGASPTGYKIVCKNGTFALVSIFAELVGFISICPPADNFEADKHLQALVHEHQLELFDESYFPGGPVETEPAKG